MRDSVRLDVGAVAEAAARLAQTREPAPLVSSLLELVRAWAAPSAAFAAVRDASVEGGWRALPGVVLGSVPVGIERSLARVAEDAPEALARGGIVQRGDEIAGVRARDNWAVPFWTGDESGALFLRGVPRPAPEGLAEALALVSAAVWPRLLGSPAERVEALVEEVRAAADRLAREAQRQLDALETHRPVAAVESQASEMPDEAVAAADVPVVSETEAPVIDESRLVALELELRTLEGELRRLSTEAHDARAEAEMLRGERDALRERVARAEAAAAESDAVREQLARAEAAAAESQSLADRLAKAEAAAAAAAPLAERLARAEAATAEGDALRHRLAKAEAAAAESEALRDQLARAEAAAAEGRSLADRLAKAEAAAAEAAPLVERLARAEAAAAEAAPLAERLARAEAATAEGDALRHRLAKAEAAAAESEALRDQLARAEAAAAEGRSLADRLAKAEAAAAEAAPLVERLARAEAASVESDAVRDRLAKAEAAAAESEALRDQLARAEVAAAESQWLAERLAKAEAAAEAATRAERLARAEAATPGSEALRDRLAKAEAAAAESEALRDQLARAEAAAAEGQSLAERLAKAEAAVAEAAPLAERLETLRRAAEAADVRSRKAEEELSAAQRDLAQARARSGLHDDDRRRRLEEAEARADTVTGQWDAARRALRAATAAVRRAAFLPPAVRVSMQEAVGPDEVPGRAAPWMGVVLLDRDAVTLETVAEALETSGVDVRIAGHPEELALLLRTADAAALGAVVCDVMAFRSDQNVAGLIRTWDRDRPGLAYFLSFDPDNAGEVERARRIPTSIIAGHQRRPLAPPRLVETLETLAKRRGKL